MARLTVPADEDTRARDARHRHELEVERRRAHPGEPRRTVVSDRPPPREDRRGNHGQADTAR